MEFRMFRAYQQSLRARSAAVLLTLENRFDGLMRLWLLGALLACSARVAAAPVRVIETAQNSLFSYILVIVAPVLSATLALRWFRDSGSAEQPATRLALFGKWRSVPHYEARRHEMYGTSGLMVSLLIGMLLNIPVRAAEYLMAMPPIPAAAPHWASVLQSAMTFDVVLFTSLYAVAFVSALRRSPLFPRLLAAIWMADLVSQLGIARYVTASSDLPAPVADALHSLLNGNVKKVLISVCLWLPYLLLSTRVNVTFRHRVPA
jgi:hypothetical protein